MLETFLTSCFLKIDNILTISDTSVSLPSSTDRIFGCIYRHLTYARSFAAKPVMVYWLLEWQEMQWGFSHGYSPAYFPFHMPLKQHNVTKQISVENFSAASKATLFLPYVLFSNMNSPNLKTPTSLPVSRGGRRQIVREGRDGKKRTLDLRPVTFENCTTWVISNNRAGKEPSKGAFTPPL